MLPLSISRFAQYFCTCSANKIEKKLPLKNANSFQIMENKRFVRFYFERSGISGQFTTLHENPSFSFNHQRRRRISTKPGDEKKRKKKKKDERRERSVSEQRALNYQRGCETLAPRKSAKFRGGVKLCGNDWPPSCVIDFSFFGLRTENYLP